MNDLLRETMQVANRLDYFKNAKILGLTDKEVIQRAADDYVLATETHNEKLRDESMAVLIVKEWREQMKMMQKCKSVSLYQYEDYYERAYYCISTACYYHAWTDPSKNTNAQACINATFASRGAAEILYQSNLDKGKANINKASLDTVINGDSDDKETTLGDLLADEKPATSSMGVDSIIKMYVKEGKLVDAIMIDNIAYGDTVKTTSVPATFTKTETTKDGEVHTVTLKTKENYKEFWAYRFMQGLNALGNDYLAQFAEKYEVNLPEMNAAMRVITETSNQKLYKQLDACREDLKKLYMSGAIQL